MARYPDKMLWLDVETPGLMKDAEILEIGVILTDTQLNELGRYDAAIALTARGMDQLRSDDYARNMHLESGLLKDCKYSSVTAREAEVAIVDMLIAKGAEMQKVIMAGSGVARFDYDIIAQQMPMLAEWLVYFAVDVGMSRREAHLATGGLGNKIFPEVEASFREGVKAHRALADAEAHLEEGRGHWNVYRSLAGLPTL
jgi:oligoribonuclease (3'-5' exoribonuclease)